MKNPILVTIEDNKHVEIGDPFIFRFNGRYYLYCSTCDEVEGIRCFTSDDLVNFSYYGLVAKSPILKHAYAPEVIYHNGEFIMCTSPRGNGHYFLKSDSPLGPFEFITDNIKNMIDGSFVLDNNNKLHFLRADHNGIVYLDVVDNKLANRKDIIPQISHAWTEGPSMIYFNKYYYITYCGNDVLSSSYRIKIASSRYIDKDYRVQHSPLLVSTKEGFSGLGHNSLVLGPSLDEYYVAYHKLDWLDEHHTTRYLCLDRLYFNGRDCSCNPSNFEVLSPKRPDIECHINEDNKLEIVSDKLLTPIILKDKFTSEFNFEGYTDLVISYVDELNYSLISFKDNIEIYEIENGRKYLRSKKNVKFDFSKFHTIRLINDEKCEIYIDNVYIFDTKKFYSGKCGFLNKDKGLYYFAVTNSTNSESLKNLPIVIPGKIEANYLNSDSALLKNEDEINSLFLKKGETLSFKVIGESNRKYKLFARMNNFPCRLLLTIGNKEENISLDNLESDYLFNLRYLTDIELNKEEEIKIKVLKGKFDVQYLKIDEIIIEDNQITNQDLDRNGEYYLFSKNSSSLSLDFNLTGSDDNLFGLIINSTNYSSWRSNKNLSLMGYFVGFDKGLLVVDYCQYDRVRIYDKPYRLLENVDYTLKVILNDNLIKVYINDNLEIETTLKYDEGYGKCGVYKSKYSKVKLFNYTEVIGNDK